MGRDAREAESQEKFVVVVGRSPGRLVETSEFDESRSSAAEVFFGGRLPSQVASRSNTSESLSDQEHWLPVLLAVSAPHL